MDIRHAAPLVNRTRFLGMSPERGDRNPHAKFLSAFSIVSSARPFRPISALSGGARSFSKHGRSRPRSGCSMPRLPESCRDDDRAGRSTRREKSGCADCAVLAARQEFACGNDQTTVVWQFETPAGTPPLTGAGGLYGDGSSPSYVSPGYSPFCRITATVSTATGVVTQASTEESNGTGSSVAVLRRGESVCSQHLRAKS